MASPKVFSTRSAHPLRLQMCLDHYKNASNARFRGRRVPPGSVTCGGCIAAIIGYHGLPGDTARNEQSSDRDVYPWYERYKQTAQYFKRNCIDFWPSTVSNFLHIITNNLPTNCGVWAIPWQITSEVPSCWNQSLTPTWQRIRWPSHALLLRGRSSKTGVFPEGFGAGLGGGISAL